VCTWSWDGAAKTIWSPKVPTKAFFCFVWAAYKGKIPTEDKLKEETLVALVDVPCVWRRKNMWIIFLCIVGGSRCFGIYFSL